ncbi:MAG: tyrosine-type recombinase/integrase [Gemmatimonadota bacterium]|nr:tyrosine-type recombinase/integrase [Gemmatimonadota bacterium]MDQ8147635.1 tyrosine-type recombinase/integrase [Gemmatimonadota bacterium]MDQ8149260.1 tyrosine-type recombinase/integrase [Gemmatimonadota bacterium]MDQ8176863.1 tyrosine-type recombinase/integrase [Gemmatimonadota bacterium]
MPTAKLGARVLDAAAPPARGRIDYVIWDAELKGFGCKITARGKRVFLFQYWSPVASGKRRRVTFGEQGGLYEGPDGVTVVLTPHSARKLAEAVRGEVAAGRDPFLDRERAERAKLDRDVAEKRARAATAAAERQRAASQRTFAEIAAERCAAWQERTTLPTSSRRRLSPRTVRERERMLRAYILPVIGTRPVEDIGPEDAEAVRRAMGVGRAIQANRVQQLCHLVLNEIDRGGRANPFALGKRRQGQWFEEQETREPLTREELGRLFLALDADDDGTRGGAYDAIRLLALTGWRKGEALSLRWDAVDLDSGDVLLAATKTGKSARSLTPNARDLLASIPRRGPFVFPSPEDARAPRQEVKRVWLRVRAAAGISKPLHSLRHSFATLALNEGVRLEMVGALLGHKNPATTLRYAKVEDQKRRAAAEAVGPALERLTAPSTAVLPLRARRSAK